MIRMVSFNVQLPLRLKRVEKELKSIFFIISIRFAITSIQNGKQQQKLHSFNRCGIHSQVEEEPWVWSDQPVGRSSAGPPSALPIDFRLGQSTCTLRLSGEAASERLRRRSFPSAGPPCFPPIPASPRPSLPSLGSADFSLHGGGLPRSAHGFLF